MSANDNISLFYTESLIGYLFGRELTVLYFAYHELWYVHCKNGLVKLTNHWLPQFHLLFSLFIYREARRSRTVL